MAQKSVPKPRKKVYCEVCSVFVSSESLLVVHNNGKKHQQLLECRAERQVCAECSIYVRGFCHTTSLENDLNDYFSKFGNVSSIFVDKEKAQYALVEFECATEAKTVLDLNELPLLHGKHLKIKRRSLKEPPTRKLQATPRNRGQRIGDAVKARHFLDKDVMDKLKRANTLDDQVKILISSTCLSDDDNQLRDLIVHYLHEIFVEVFPECEVVPFGSFSTGLGLKGSDLDLCLFAEPALLEKSEYRDEGNSSSNSISDQLEFIVQLLKQFAAGFQNVVAVVSAKCPLAKFSHRDSGLSCDLSINNRLAVRNTELIKAYVALDDRIRPLAITLKNWSGAKRLTGSGGRYISNYSMVLMLLHFLQRTRPPVIPVLQKTHEENDVTSGTDKTGVNKTVIDGWDCSFATVMKRGESGNKESFGNLLTKWFYYYGHTFDYGNEVITIQNNENERVLKLDVGNSILKAGKPNLFKLSPLCVQDPFELSHNLTQGVSVDVLRHFIQSCMDAHSSLTHSGGIRSAGSSTSKTKANIEEAFLELFTLPTGISEKQKRLVYSFSIPLLPSVLKSNERKEVRDRFKQTCEFVTETLTRDLQVSCESQLSGRYTQGDHVIEISRDTSFYRLENNVCPVAGEDACPSSLKRAGEEDGRTEAGDVKKAKYCNREEGDISFFLLCKAVQVTWQNRRKQRRLRKHNDGSGVEESRSSRSAFANQGKCLEDHRVEHDNKPRDQSGLTSAVSVQSPIRSNDSAFFEQAADFDKFQSVERVLPGTVATNQEKIQVDGVEQHEENIMEKEFTQAVLPNDGRRSRTGLTNVEGIMDKYKKRDAMAQHVREAEYSKNIAEKSSEQSNEKLSCPRTTDIKKSRSSAGDLAFTRAHQATSEPHDEMAQNEKNRRETGLNQAPPQISPDESRDNLPWRRTCTTTPAYLGSAKCISDNSDQPLVEFTLKIEPGNHGHVMPNKNECSVVLSYSNGSIHHFSNFYAFFKKFIVRKITEHTLKY